VWFIAKTLPPPRRSNPQFHSQQLVVPAAPTGLTATAGNAYVSLSWTASSGASSYNIYRATSSGGEGGTPYQTGITTTCTFGQGHSMQAGFGGNDCKNCPAHLYHTSEAPSCKAFTEVVRQAIPGHGPIYYQRID